MSFGFAFDRQATGSHEIWYNSQTDRYSTIPNHYWRLVVPGP